MITEPEPSYVEAITVLVEDDINSWLNVVWWALNVILWLAEIVDAKAELECEEPFDPLSIVSDPWGYLLTVEGFNESWLAAVMELRVAVESSNLVEVETVETIPPDHPNIELLPESTDGLKAEFVAPGIEVSVVVEKPIALSEVVNSEVVSEFFIAPETKVFAKVFDKVSVSILSK